MKKQRKARINSEASENVKTRKELRKQKKMQKKQKKRHFFQTKLHNNQPIAHHKFNNNTSEQHKIKSKPIANIKAKAFKIAKEPVKKIIEETEDDKIIRLYE